VIELEDASGVTQEDADVDVSLSYARQAAAFLDWLADGPPLPVDGSAGLRSLALAEQVRAISP
jgi:hypothetical protein